MTVTAIQIGLHPDAVHFESPDFALRSRQLPDRHRRGGRGEGTHVAGDEVL
jgi:hypothetical protein